MKFSWKKTLTLWMTVCMGLSGIACTRSETAPRDPVGCVINGTEISFVGEPVKKTWEEPLVRLLTKSLTAESEDGFFDARSILDSENSIVPPGYCYGLLDVTTDGVPELLIHPYGYGGSAGNATYFIFDIHSQQCLGSIDGGQDGTWCTYLHKETGELTWMARFWWRYGWAERERFIKKLEYDPALQQYTDAKYLCIYHGVESGLADSAADCVTESRFYLSGQEVFMEEYYAEYDRFLQNWIPVPETELVLFGWGDVSSIEDSGQTKAKKMAQALIGSEQEFILYD